MTAQEDRGAHGSHRNAPPGAALLCMGTLDTVGGEMGTASLSLPFSFSFSFFPLAFSPFPSLFPLFTLCFAPSPFCSPLFS